MTRRDDTIDVLHGTAVPDPYRWLEDADDPEVREWVAAQNLRTREALDPRPSRADWTTRLTGLMTVPVVQGAEVRGDAVVVLERGTGAEQARLLVRSLSSGTVVVLADPAAGTGDAAAAVDWFSTSPDGSLVAFGVSEGGTEQSVLRIARAGDGALLGEEIPRCRAASIAWEPDSTGFHYTRYPDGGEYHRTVYHHHIGDDWRADPVVWAGHVTPQTWPEVASSPDGRFVLVTAMVGWGRDDLHLLDRSTGTWTALVEGVEAVNGFRFADDTTLIGRTTLGATRGRIVSIDASAPPSSPSDWTTLVGEREVVVGVPHPTSSGWYVVATDRAVDRIECWVRGSDTPVEVGGLGIASVNGLAVDPDGAAFAVVTGFDRPPSLVRIDAEPVVPWPVDAPGSGIALAVRQVDVTSPDGTLIGLFVVHRPDLEPGPDTPTILSGYGGFSITETPTWSPLAAAWCEAGGVYALAGLRGGGEHGEAWHHAGRRGHKQNVFDDFGAAADWLVEHGLTTRDRLAIAGGSNGGLLVGATLTQRPDLCRAVWCAVPLLDMIRFPQFLIARLWTDEYGDPDVAEEFAWLWAYSPYHRVVEGGRYPAVLLTTADGDSRVDPLHARKMAAALQHAAVEQDDRPVLLHQEDRAGHGVGKPVGKRVAEYADVLTFLSWQLGIDRG